jgi:mannose PTS system EIIA component
MIGVAICTHAGFASGLKEACEMIAGEQENFVALGFTFHDELIEYSEKLKHLTKDFSDGCIYVCDMIHASPYNAALMCIYETNNWVLSGACLPMVIEILIARSIEGATVESIVNVVKGSYHDYLGFTSSDDVFK